MQPKSKNSDPKAKRAGLESGEQQATPSPLPRWYYLLRYHQSGQLFRRLRNNFRNRWLKKFAASSYLRPPREALSLRENYAFCHLLESKLVERRMRGALKSAKRIVAREFCFLDQTITFPQKIDWRLTQHPDVDALWRFHFHYHEYLLDLAVADQQSESFDYTAKAWHIILDWIKNNSPANSRVFTDAWHPFCISRRLPVWLLLWSADPPPADQRQQILKSIVSQTNFLADHLETDLGGNHLLENLRALALVGCFLDGLEADRWLTIVRQRLPQELATQITFHGEHYERSPMYHAFMLEAVLDLHVAAFTVDQTIATASSEAAIRMGNFLRTILHPDGEIPLLSDSSLNSAPSPSLLIKRLQSSTSTSTPQKSSSETSVDRTAVKNPAKQTDGYWTFNSGQDFLLFDAAPACPNHLPAHAHADLLNIEASVAGQRLFVDTGVYNYAAGQMRQHCRGTSSHNVLQIDDVDQFDIWSRFRMGYRGQPSQLKTGTQHGFHWAQATHNAYRRIKVPLTGRLIACRPQGPWLCLDWAQGPSEHLLTQRLHLHPQVEATQTDEKTFTLRVANLDFQLQTLGSRKADLQKGWYCPTFGNRQVSQVITWQLESQLPATLGWALSWPEQEGSAKLLIDEGSQPILTWYEKQSVFRWAPHSDGGRK